MPWGKRIWPAWARSVEAMIKAGAIVRVHCRKCESFLDVDLVAVRAARGKNHSLINGSTDCRLTRCRGRAYFLAARSMEDTFLLLVAADMGQMRERLEQIRPIDIEPPTSDEPPPSESAAAAAAA